MSDIQASKARYFIGLMSGTSLDGVNAVLAEMVPRPLILASLWLAYPEDIKAELLELQESGRHELARLGPLSNRIAGLYADAVHALLAQAGIQARVVRVIGSHGQAVRHQPSQGYSLQANNPALLAELTGIPVVTDFRSRDLAAGGQGGPLASAFHAAVFRQPGVHRAVANIGGIASLTYLPADGRVIGFDCGPGTLLLDTWVKRHWGCDYDPGGSLSAQGRVLDRLLQGFQSHPYFARTPPKSAGRQDFSIEWLDSHIPATAQPEDVLATLLELSVRAIANGVRGYCPGTREIWLCGGGAHNEELRRRLSAHLPGLRMGVTDELGVHVDWVETLACAWLARQCLAGHTGNLPQVTGARGARVLGALYPA
ncbi:MAG TPA: anhydro-N-acetylmuramic acid kinase [Thiobacillaceae bacterium]|nr:anhydro-N-acetylmuramic acid kinase [Thiobacillaceae bacterium]